MKKIIMLFALVTFIACKNKEATPEVTKSDDTKEVEAVAENTVDYESFGMQNEDAPKGLVKGTKAPDVDFVIDGKRVALVDLYKDQNVAIIFYRGFWCPVCSKHLAEFATRAKELEAKGVKLIAVTPEGEEGVEKTKDKSKATFAIVSDTDGSIQEAFDVDYKVTDAYAEKVKEALKISIPENNGSETAQLPVPATYVIDKTGTIIYAHFDPNYKKRASIDDILAAL
tara:strand:- start:12785 stop:13465 length:681 start_codon:yes stop_codon:yes gene_type:complete